jgi:lysozyme
MKIFFTIHALLISVEVFLLLAIREKNMPAIEPLPAAPAPAIQAPAIQAPAIQAPAIQAPAIQAPAVPRAVPRAVPFQADADALLVSLIKEKEGFYSRPYRCPAGVLTIGYGFTDAKYVRRGSMTEKEASRILEEEIIPAVKKIVRETVRVPLTPYQTAALASFVFNCGESNLRRLVNGENRLNAGNYQGTADALLLYVKADGKTLRGLVERRKKEQKIFLGET